MSELTVDLLVIRGYSETVCHFSSSKYCRFQFPRVAVYVLLLTGAPERLDFTSYHDKRPLKRELNQWFDKYFKIQDSFIAICSEYNGMLAPHSLLQYSSKHTFENNSKQLVKTLPHK